MSKHNNYGRNMGSVSTGTMREEDLIDTFTWELEHQKPLQREHRQLIKEIRARIEGQGEDYYASEDAGYDLGSLFDALDAYAPPYFYFGAHPGDGADFGFWLAPLDDFEGLKVNDLAEVPKGFSGEVLLVNDHDNLTLLSYSRGRGREVWAVV